MEDRQPAEQFEHDLVVQAAAEQFGNSVRYDIHANPGTERNAGVAGRCPDIVVTDKGTGKVKFVIEVETVGSVNDAEVKQWRELAGLGPPLFLLVPWRVLPIAERLCGTYGVKCHFGHYLQDDQGRFKIVLKRD
ncbi:hypothetical protein FJY71_01475 [candidate division WOR-3 bacterium]|nr:hypothetical protein [candidate division WOR-3 bacterium]